jgi:hypothetical protein
MIEEPLQNGLLPLFLQLLLPPKNVFLHSSRINYKKLFIFPNFFFDMCKNKDKDESGWKETK